MPKTYKYKKSFTHNGKRYWVYADTKIQLGRNLLAKQQALDTQEYEESNIKLKDWAILCIDTYKVNQKDITRRKYMSRVNHCIIQHLGDKPIKKYALSIANQFSIYNMEIAKPKLIQCIRLLDSFLSMP